MSALVEGPSAVPACRPGLGRRRSPWWLAVAVLALLVASDQRFRVRDVENSVSGRPDAVVLLEIATYGAVALWLAVHTRWRPGTVRATPVLAAGWVFAGLYALSALYSPYAALAVVRAVQLLVIAAVGQCVAWHADRRQVHHCLHALLLLVLAGVVLGVVAPPEQPGGGVRRFTWLAVHPVLAGTYLSIAIVIAVAYLVRPRLRELGPGWAVPAYGAMLVVFAAALLANKTRGALVGAALGALMVLLLGLRRADRSAVLPGALVLALGVAGLLGDERLRSYVERGQSVDDLTSLNYRTTLWTEALAVWREQPLAGQGLGATRGAFLESTGLGGGHNALINVLVDAGVVGAGAWLMLLVLLARAGWQAGRNAAGEQDRPVLLGILACLVVNGITTEGLGQSANVSMVLLYVLVGWVVLLSPRTARSQRARG